MAVVSGPEFPGVKRGLIFAVDAANPESWQGPTSNTINNLILSNPTSGSIYNDPTGSFGENESFTFDGVGDYIGVENNTLIFSDKPFTISIWFNSSSDSTGDMLFLVNNLSRAFWIQISSTTVNFRSRYSGIWDPGKTAPGTIDADTWYNYTLTYNGNSPTNLSNFQAFINSSPSTLQEGSTSSQNAYNNYNVIGASLTSGNPGGNFNGDIGPVLIYNRVLSSGEILQNYNQLKPRFT